MARAKPGSEARIGVEVAVLGGHHRVADVLGHLVDVDVDPVPSGGTIFASSGRHWPGWSRPGWFGCRPAWGRRRSGRPCRRSRSAARSERRRPVQSRAAHRQLICREFSAAGAAPPLSTGGRVSAGGFGGAVGGVRFRGRRGGCRARPSPPDGVARNRRDVVADRRYDGGQSIVGRRGPSGLRCARAARGGHLGGGTLAAVARTVRHAIAPGSWLDLSGRLVRGRPSLFTGRARRSAPSGCLAVCGCPSKGVAHRAHMT